MNLEELWVKYSPIYTRIGEVLHMITPFFSIYLCEFGFSSLALLKTAAAQLAGSGK
jgi:hypothetical protein